MEQKSPNRKHPLSNLLVAMFTAIIIFGVLQIGLELYLILHL